MITLLSRLLIPGYQNTDLPEVRSRYGILSGTVGIFLNLILFAGKLTAGILVRSVSIMADAFNNLSDAASSVITLAGFKLAGKRPDADHPFGHGRIEYITGLVVSISILLMGFELAKTSIARILRPETVLFSKTAAVVLIISILVKLYMFLYNRHLGFLIDSVALRSTAIDSLSDCISTGVVLICLVFSHKFGLSLDGWCGLTVSLFILYAGIQALSDTASPLVGKAPDPELIGKITERVLETPGILDMHDLLVHDYGPGHFIVSLHAEVPSDLSLLEAHEIIDKLESGLDREFGVQSLIHIDPVETGDREANALRGELLAMIKTMHPDAGLHDLRILRGDSVPVVSFDALIPYSLEESDENIVQKLTDYISSRTGGYQVIVRIDRI